MKTCFRFLITVGFFLTLAQSSKASHTSGGEITYAWVNSCTVRVTVNTFAHCYWSFFPYWYAPTWTGGPGCVAPPTVGAIVKDSLEITPVCPGANTQCTTPGATLGGFFYYTLYQDYNVCAVSPCTYNLSWSTCCRDIYLTSLSNSPVQDIQLTSTSIHTGMMPRNASPRFLGPPLMYVQDGQAVDISAGAFDPDADSVSFELGNCYRSLTASVTYNAGYSGTAPLGPGWNVTIDAATGLMHLQPVPGQPTLTSGPVCIFVKEYRNGVQIGSIMRDVLLVVLPSSSNDVPVVSGVSNLSGATAAGDELYVGCPGTVSFDITGSDSSSGQGMMLAWSANYPTASFTQVGNPLVQDTIPGLTSAPPAGHFDFTAPAPGHYYVRFILADDQCPLLGVSERVIAIHVGAIDAAVTVDVGACPDVNFSVATCGSGPFTYAWTGAGGLSSSTAVFSHTYPGPGSYAWELIVTGPFAADTIRDTVVVPGLSYSSFLSGVHYVAPCSGFTHDTIDAGGGWQSYLWSTGESTQAIAVFLGGYYGVTVTDTTGCAYHDSTELFWAEPDIYGVVETSLGGPLQNQKIMLIQHDTLLQALWGVDSTWTDSAGYYYFCNVVDSLVFLKALPLLADYPNQMPTYADTTLYWNNAIAFQPVGLMPFQHDFATLYGTNPGGPGFIGGFISQGANKVSAVGDPVPGVRVFLRNSATGAILGYRDSNPAGYFSFAGVPLGDYELVPDRVNVSITNVPALSLTAQAPVRDSLDFQLHRYWLELVLHSTAVDGGGPQFSYAVAPNPFTHSTQVRLQLAEAGIVSWELCDVAGRVVDFAEVGELAAGEHRFQVGGVLPAGCYFLRMQVGGKTLVGKVVALREY
jgi:hypothetical protein